MWDYLRATAGHFPDRAAASLLQEMIAGPQANDIELRTRLRQVVPFRDGGWTRTGESVAEYAMQHWRWSRAAGFEAPPHLLAFYRGLFWIARTGHALSPSTDPVGSGLDGLQWLASFNQWRQLMAPKQALHTAEGYWSSWLTLPQKLDRALDRLEDSTRTQAPGGSQARSPGSAPSRRSSIMALALGMVACGLLVRGIGDAGSWSLWIEQAGTILFLIFAVLLLHAAMARDG